jgi:hypothetical protein
VWLGFPTSKTTIGIRGVGASVGVCTVTEVPPKGVTVVRIFGCPFDALEVFVVISNSQGAALLEVSIFK